MAYLAPVFKAPINRETFNAVYVEIRPLVTSSWAMTAPVRFLWLLLKKPNDRSLCPGADPRCRDSVWQSDSSELDLTPSPRRWCP